MSSSKLCSAQGLAKELACSPAIRERDCALFWRQKGGLNSPVIIAIHGWASNGDIWDSVREQLPDYGFLTVELPGFGVVSTRQCMSLRDYAQSVARAIAGGELGRLLANRTTYLVGWSLGGQVAAEIAACIPQSIAGLVTLASNPCFVAKQGWPSAMAASTYSTFCENFAQNPAKTLKRFNALQVSGAQSPRALRTLMSACLPLCGEQDVALWQQALVWLATDCRAALASFDKPQLHLLAADDALVPSVVPLQQFGEVQVMPSAGHCMPLASSHQVARAIRVFTKTHSVVALDKQRVARAFSAAAEQYDGFAKVQKVVASEVLARSAKLSPGHLADIGCGTGAITQGLANRGHTVLALDIALGMVQFAKRQQRSQVDIRYLAADAELLPLADNCLDGLVSSLAIQWCSDPALLCCEVHRVLKPGGRAVIATLGPGTLRELKLAWQAVDDCVHVNGFISQPCLRRAIEAAGLEVTRFDVVDEKLTYPSVGPLLKELKAIGAHNVHIQAPAGLMTRTKLKALSDAYPLTPFGDDANEGALVASYDVFYIELSKPLS